MVVVVVMMWWFWGGTDGSGLGDEAGRSRISESVRWAQKSSRFGQVFDVVNVSRRWSRPVEVLTTAGQVLQMLVLPR